MSYWVYDRRNDDPHQAVIHHGQCEDCNDGSASSEDGRWIGPFRTLLEARTTAGNTGSEKHKEHTCIKKRAEP